MKKSLLIASAAIAAAALPQVASASIVYDANIVVSGQGFGAAPRLITVDNKAQATVESGCTTPNSDGEAGVGCLTTNPAAPVGIDLTGPVNVGGDEAEPFPGTSAKNSTPTLSELQWTNAGEILLVFNAIETDGGGVNIQDVTLKFYSGSNLLAVIDGSQNIAETVPGNGGAGFAFVISEDEQARLNTQVFGSAYNANTRVAMETTMSNVSAGAESWTALRRTAPGVPEPATWGMMLIGFGVIGAAMRRRRAVGNVRVRLNYA